MRQRCIHTVYDCICMWRTCTHADQLYLSTHTHTHTGCSHIIICAGSVYLIESEGTCFTSTEQDVEPRYHGDHFRWPWACCGVFAVEFLCVCVMVCRVLVVLSILPLHKCDGDVRLTTCCSNSVTLGSDTHAGFHTFWLWAPSWSSTVGLWTFTLLLTQIYVLFIRLF